MEEELLTIKEMAKRLGYHEKSVYRLIDRGKIIPIRLGRTLRISESEYQRFIGKGRNAQIN